MKEPLLRLLRLETYERAALKSVLDAELEADGFFARLQGAGKRRLLLKPNFVMAAPPEDPSCTHPDFYMAVAELLLARGFAVGIGESPAFGSCRGALARHGVLEEVLAKGIEVVEFKVNETIAGVPQDASYEELTIAAELRQWDALINLPKIKVHQQFVFTAAAKNLYGCVVGKRKFFRHNTCANDEIRFARMILANAAAAAPILTIADGITAMHVKGPRGGKAYPLCAVVLAADTLECDHLVARLIGLDPAKTPLFSALSSEELSPIAARSLRIAVPKANGFVQSYRVAISFSPWQILRSFWRSLLMRWRSRRLA